MTTQPNENYDHSEYDESNEETFDDERLDSIAIHEEKRSTTRYVQADRDGSVLKRGH